ncbi:MAG: T9SS type A sorting domain-containing protein [Bacteroidota bacterium]
MKTNVCLWGRQISFLSFLMLALWLPASAQICIGDTTLSSQAEVDAFNCVQIQGNLTISGNNIVHLDSLHMLTKVDDLIIQNNDSLTSLHGFNTILEITGNLHVEDNLVLLTMQGLQFDAAYFDGNVIVKNNASLENLDGPPFAFGVIDELEIMHNPSLMNVDGLSGVDIIGFQSEISYNDTLDNLNGLQTSKFSHSLEISHNRNLKTLNCFNPVSSFAFDLIISHNDSLKTISGFNGLVGTQADLTIEENLSLESITGFSNITSVGGYLEIKNNPQLDTLSGFSSLQSVGFELNFTNNSLGSFTGFSPLSSVGLGVSIANNSSLSNINNLSNLQSAHSIYIGGNPMLTSTVGLNSLTSLSGGNGSLSINGNASLNSLGSFSSLTQVGFIDIRFNPLLTSVSSFPSLSSLSSIHIQNNTQLSSFELLSSPNSLSGNLAIENNPSLHHILGLSSLTSIQNFSLRNNDSLAGVDAFASLSTIQLSLTIQNNDYLLNLDSLIHLSSVGGNLTIVDNDSLAMCCGVFPLLDNGGVAGTTNIQNNISGCDSENEILTNCIPSPIPVCIGDIFLSTQAEVNAFNCLEIQGDLTISGGDITYLDSLHILTKVDNLIIQNNDSLSLCCGILPILQSGGVVGTTTISNNDMGCNSVQEVLTTCGPPSSLCMGDASLTTQAEVDSFDCQQVNGNLTISGNNILHLDSLASLISISGNLTIAHNDSLSDLNGLNMLSSIGGDLLIQDNPLLEAIDGFSLLDTIHGSLTILDNVALMAITGLSDLFMVREDVSLNRQPDLTVCCGLYNLFQFGTVLGNTSLAPTGQGCQLNDILISGPCTVAIDPSYSPIRLGSAYPNPATDQIIIPFTLSTTAPVRLSLYDVHASLVHIFLDQQLPSGEHEVILPVGDLASGLYHYQLEGNGFRFRLPLIIKN